MTFVLIAMIIGIFALTGLAFGSLNNGALKKYFLRHRSFVTGYWTCGIIGMSTLLFWTLVGAFFGKYGVLAGLIVGLFMGMSLGITFWNKGVRRVRLKYRAVPVWRGKRQSDPKLEMSEDKYWLFPWFFTFDEFPIKEFTDKVLGIPIEVRDENTVPTDITIQWRYADGRLVNAGNLDDPMGAFESELKEVARAFGVSRRNIDSLIDESYPELLKAAALEHLIRRSNGETNTISINPVTGKATFTPITGIVGKKQAKPWGIEFISISVPNFTPPPKVTETAEEITAATNRVEGSKIELTQINAITNTMTSERSMQPTAAASLAAAMVLPPERRPNLVTHNHVIEGLDGMIRTIVNGVLAYTGRQPLPGMTLTPPVTTNPQGPAPTDPTVASQP